MSDDQTTAVIDDTKSICPVCMKTIDAQVMREDGRVVLRKECAVHGPFAALLSTDADAYVASLPYNKPGETPLQFSTEVVDGCPHDCGLCPDHQQHTCSALIEVNSDCNLDCPICFANAQDGFSLTLEQVEGMLDRLFELESAPEVVQFSGGEPSIHPDILPMMKMAFDKGIPVVMLNTNGLRIATDDRFLAALADIRPTIYLQFDGFNKSTNHTIRGADLTKIKIKALDRLAKAQMDVVLVPTIDNDVNHDEIGDIVRFGLKHPAVRGIAFQPVTHSGRFPDFDPMDRETLADVVRGMDEQTDGLFVKSDFIPVPCCHPTCRVATYAYVEGDEVTPLPRVVEVDKYLDYITNRTLPDIQPELLTALEGLWSAASVPGTDRTASLMECAACNLAFPSTNAYLKAHVFMIVVQGFADAYTMDLKAVSKCCIGELTIDGKMIPFCTYNTVGYREKELAKLAALQPAPLTVSRK
jgi:uncharacterized radical SAM superfamily Fe-S cluster-containing enzyme